ncbi:MAG TPA: hypothetical protein VIA06_20860 [Candidatus Dormibacteraeota bacterium]|nr:hypothetical protein [Candidatus Dormibacteraeota bacterium]
MTKKIQQVEVITLDPAKVDQLRRAILSGFVDRRDTQLCADLHALAEQIREGVPKPRRVPRIEAGEED